MPLLTENDFNLGLLTDSMVDGISGDTSITEYLQAYLNAQEARELGADREKVDYLMGVTALFGARLLDDSEFVLEKMQEAIRRARENETQSRWSGLFLG